MTILGGYYSWLPLFTAFVILIEIITGGHLHLQHSNLQVL